MIRTPSDSGKTTAPWGKALYLISITCLAGYLIVWAYEHLLFVTGVGFLEAETTYIEARTPGRILKFNCDINDTVKVGQPLVILGETRSVTLIGMNGNGNESYTEQERKLIGADGKIKQLREEILHKKQEIGRLRQEHTRGSNLLAINVITRPDFIRIEERLKDATYQRSILEIQLEAATKLLASYKERYSYDPDFGFISGTGGERVLRAQEEGVISSIFKERGEVARLGEPVIKIMNPGKVFIRAYFSGSNEKSLFKGDRVKVIFANGERSEGLVRDIHPTAYSQPAEMQKRFGVADRQLIAEIIPANDEPWRRVLETKVRVLVPRRWF